METLWGIDLGGSKIEGVVLNIKADKPEVISRLRISTEREKGYRHIIEKIVRMVDLLRRDSGLEPNRIGIGTPGAFDPIAQCMKNCNTTVLNGKPLLNDLRQALKLPVRIANDANCFAIAEVKLGAVREKAPEAQVAFGVIMGTGVGGGLVVNNQLINGRQGIAGEWGHNFLDLSGGSCYCGRVGCTETLISGPALEQFYTRQSKKALKLPAIIDRARDQSDEAAVKTLERLLQFFGKGVAQVINLLDPDVIILGGGLGNIDELYKEARSEILKNLFNPRLDTIFLKPKLGDSAGVFGAALL